MDSKNVRKIRKNSECCTQEQFAEKIDTTARTVSNIERGKVTPTLLTVYNIANYANVSMDDIVGLKKS